MRTRQEKLERELEHAVTQLRTMGAQRVILFGSLARDIVRIGSDIDLIAIFDDDRNFKERMRHVYERLEVAADVDVLAYNFEEFERLKHRTFFRHALKEGRVIYEA